jgi:glycosyltransferase involved in cell wall biosynthesis
VVEGRRSAHDFWGKRLEVRSLGVADPGRRPGSALRQGRLRNFIGGLRNGRFGSLGEAFLYGGFRVYDWHRHYHVPRRLIPEADLYYLHSFETHRAVAPAAARCGSPIIYDAHDFYRGIEPPEMQPSFDRNRLRPFYNGLENRLASAADAVVTVSDGVADALCRVFGRRPEVIRNCHDERHDRSDAPDLRNLLGLGATDRLCVIIGNYKPGMAIGVAAAALARLPDRFHLAFVGRGYEAAVPTLSRDLLGSRLHIGHAFAPDAIVPAVRSADLALMIYEKRSINYRHALPNGFFQAVAAGLPLVRARLVEIETVIGDRAIGMRLERLDPVELAEAVIRCLDDAPKLRKNIAALSRDLSWSAEARRLRTLIDRVMRERRVGDACEPASGGRRRAAAGALVSMLDEWALRTAPIADTTDEGAAPHPRICLLAVSAIQDDPRVRRQGELFAARGWEVTGVGLAGGHSEPPGWPILSEAGDAMVPEQSLPPLRISLEIRSIIRRIAVAARILGLRLARMLQLRIALDLAEDIFWKHRRMSPSVNAVYRAAQAIEADIWLANDWTALPLAARLALEKGGIYVYDTHEFATEEFAEKPAWRRWTRPIVAAIEGRYIRDAALVSTVSAGIGKRLDRLYALARPTLIVRNTPRYEASGFRPTRSPIRVLYHGIVVPGRGLELAIDSVVEWRPEFELTIRGPENPKFTPALRKRIAALGLADRVRLTPPVPMTALVREAAAFDIGFFALPGHSGHNEFALPNKIFEYIMAGLCLCTTRLPEMAGVIEQYELGATIPALDACAIAGAINGLDRSRIDACKQNSLRAARELCWERESKPLLASYAALLARPAGLSG